jgi:zinc transporter, ZIP family
LGIDNWIPALILSLLAGLSTGIGGLFVLMFRTTNKKFLSVALGFSAGIMIYISFMELLPDAKVHLAEGLGAEKGGYIALLAFFVGIVLIAAIDKFVPEGENPHEIHNIEEIEKCDVVPGAHKLMKTSVLTAIAITIHNFPEGMATFISTVSEINLGIAVAIAVAIHNIPEGIAVAIPAYCASGSRKKAFLYSLLSGAAEPLGAVFAFLFLAPYLTETLLGLMFAGVAGIMIYISFDELLPTARQYGEHHLTIYGLLSGMLVMGVSLQVLM